MARAVAATDDDARLYRTGDLVRARADGRIEFLGRIDQQVKVRGFRIELGEIEAVLGRNPAVDEAIVLARDDANGDKRLVAYVTLNAAGATVSASQLRRSVQDALPHYMVPSIVEFVDAMPRTPNGKTNRNAMPEPDWSLVGRDTPYVAPRDDTEARMAALWEQQLGIDSIGVHDDFFELGVESIVAARLFARIEREFGVELPVGTVFANPTVEQLSVLVAQGPAGAPRWKSLVAIQPRGDQRPVFGVHGGAGTVLLFGELARRLGASGRPFYGLQAQGLYGRDPVHARVDEMAAAYVPQIRAVQPSGPYVLIGYCFGSLVAYEIAQQLRAAGETVELLVSINGPSTGYIARHDPDGLLGDDDADDGAPRSAAGAPTDLPARLKRDVRKRVREAQLWWALRAQRPLPERMRENRWFQALSVRAQKRYRMQPYPGRVAVLRAAGLYAEPDLGFGEIVTGPLECVEVPGHQPQARWTMKEPTVGFVARRLTEMLDALEATAPQAGAPTMNSPVTASDAGGPPA